MKSARAAHIGGVEQGAAVGSPAYFRSRLIEVAAHEAGHGVVAWADWVAVGRPPHSVDAAGVPQSSPWQWATVSGARDLSDGSCDSPRWGQLGEVTGCHLWHQTQSTSDAISVAGIVAERVAAGWPFTEHAAEATAWFWVTLPDPAFRDLNFTTWKGSAFPPSILRIGERRPRQKPATRQRRAEVAIMRAQAILLEHRSLWERFTAALAATDHGIAWSLGGAEIFGEEVPESKSTG